MCWLEWLPVLPGRYPPDWDGALLPDFFCVCCEATQKMLVGPTNFDDFLIDSEKFCDCCDAQNKEQHFLYPVWMSFLYLIFYDIVDDYWNYNVIIGLCYHFFDCHFIK